MTTTRGSAKRPLPRGRRLAAAVLAGTLAGTTLVACGANAKGAQPAAASAKNADETAARITWGTCPAPAEGRPVTPT
ncbi:hypothetical protein LN042_05255 [Kitasatospora sp. RB6PN24]|uniref:hypothetical protein n=1 Tax=Kitasatospora humi TaxID=2893891 RepID=UPI001E2DC131|nr:hypothetical protein [Kitasatospora humi]MCC9306521.1 hypothetical protein [Kitasatospora humi]